MLCNSQGINRNLLAWLKLWDGIVFGKSEVKKKKKQENAPQKKDKKFGKYKEEDNDWMVRLAKLPILS